MNKNTLIVLEGLDGCGKSTQFDIISQKLGALRPTRAISFPEYDKPSSALVKMYLNGDFSKSPDGVNPYAASTFYAADRYASYKLYWENDYQNGTVILAGRYVSSNAIYQSAKLNQRERDNFLDWLDDYEYEKMKIPRPDSVVFLDMPTEVSQKLLEGRYGGDEKKKDIHEADKAYMKRCREAALYVAKKQGWRVVDCCNEDKSAPLPINIITEKIMDIIREVI
ncbi:MAG: deoxynucleoside kinase [Oscillospiraceae bacterium]|nr:deoxynucleoside kinase [Oscillospiraceae bacterium]